MFPHPTTSLFWLGNDVYRTPLPPPPKFTVGPTCSAVREGVKEASFPLCPVFLWLLGKHLHLEDADTLKRGSLFVEPPSLS